MASFENQREFWDRWHDISVNSHTLTTSDPERLNGRYLDQTIATLLRHVNLDTLPDLTVLDYGCGTGRLSLALAPLVKKYICVDISPKMLQTARINLRSCETEVVFSTPDKLSLKFGEVDFTFSYASLSYESTKHRFWKIVKEIDFFSKAFALHLHGEPNKVVRKEGNITRNPGLGIFDVQGYRPSSDDLKKKYPQRNYLVERHKPDVRDADLFFYKLHRKNVDTYLRFGPPFDYRMTTNREGGLPHR